MDIEVLETRDSAAGAAAAFIVAAAERALDERGRFTLAVSGSETPARLFDGLGKSNLPWSAVHLFQVDERAAPDASPDRTFTVVRNHLLALADIPRTNLHLMPVGLPHLGQGANRYAEVLRAVCGDPPVLDLVHLGLGVDGHTASLFPGHREVGVEDADVVATGRVAGWVRLTLTVPVLRRARSVMWLVTGRERADALRDLVAHADIPAARIDRDDAVVFADLLAASHLGPSARR